jgi:tetratricopeptide (TPR) repeat protein
MFKKYLRGFSDASGDMESLYTSILSKFEEEESRWVKEIIKWLVVAKKSLTVQELKEAVELSLDDQLPEFSEFLEVECGSMVHLLEPSPEGNIGSEGEPVAFLDQLAEEDNFSKANTVSTEAAGSFTVQLVHETLRSYLTNPEHCPMGFQVDEELANSEALRVCLRLLSEGGKDKRFTQYAALNWGEHLTNLNNPKQMSNATLTDLYHLFHSDGCKTWIKLGLLNFDVINRSYYSERSPTEDEPFLQNLHQYLVRWNRPSNSADSVDKPAPSVLRWASEVVNTPSMLEGYVGKVSAELWIYGKLPPFETTRAFWLCVKHYCKRNGLDIQQLTDLEPLAKDQFACLAAWADQDQKRVPETLSLALAYYELHLWEDSVAYLKAVTISDDQPYPEELFRRLGEACVAMGDNDGAMDAFCAVTKRFPPENVGQKASRWYSLGLVYKAKRDWDGAIQAIQKALEVGYGYEHTPPMYLSLAELYGDKGEHEKMVETFEAAIEVRGEKWWVCQYLAETCKALGDDPRAKAAYKKGSEFHLAWAQSGLRGMENHMDDSNPNINPILHEEGSISF